MNLPIKVYSYSACGTCRKALKWLDKNNIKYELIDITIEPPSKEVIAFALEQVEDRKFLLNTSGKSYRLLGPQVVKGMTDVEVVNALSSDGRLIKRPFLVDKDGKVLVGFKEANWIDCFSN